MNLDELEIKAKSVTSKLRGLNYVVRFNFDGIGFLTLDGKALPPVISREDKEAACTITLTPENFVKLLDGALDPTMAYATGKLKIRGSMGVALKLSSMLGE